MTERARGALATATAGGTAYPVSSVQESLLDGVTESAVTVPAVAPVAAGVAPAAVQRALDLLVARHGALRTVFARPAGRPIEQHVRPTGELPLAVTRHRAAPPADLLGPVLRAGAEEPFVLTGAPLARAELHLAGDAGGLVVVWLHHVVSDLVSVQVLAEELGRLLRGAPLDPPGLSMAEYAAAERAVRPTARQWDRWAGALESADAWLGLAAPAGTPHQLVRPALPPLGPEVVDGLGRLAADRRTTVTAVLAAAVLAAHAGEARADRCVIGLTVSNRERPQLRSTIGCLADQLPLVVDLGGRPTFAELVGRVREALLDAYDARLPLGVLRPLLGRSAAPVFGVNLNFLPPPGRRRADPGVPQLPFGITKRRAEPWWLGDAALAYRPRIDAGGLAGEIEGDAHLQDPAEIRRRGRRFCALLAAAADNPDLDVHGELG